MSEEEKVFLSAVKNHVYDFYLSKPWIFSISRNSGLEIDRVKFLVDKFLKNGMIELTDDSIAKYYKDSSYLLFEITEQGCQALNEYLHQP